MIMANKESNLGITVKKDEDFSEWYTQTLTKSQFMDYTDVSGCMVFRPGCYAVWEIVKSEIDKRLKRLGIQNSYFPLLIPEKLLNKEKEHVEGFSPEVAWVTHTGNSKLPERLAIRPTSETIMYPSYAKWIRSWKDLPLRLNQWNNVIRWEFKNAVPLLRSREFLWNEGHTVFAKKEEAEREIQDIINVWKEIGESYLALPGLIGQKSEKETFAGAEYTHSVEYLLPNGKAIQGPDAHFDGQKFSKAFDINFLDENVKKQYPYQNTFAFTTRMLGVMFAIHGDDKGLILPPKIAPNKVVIVPIYFKDSEKKVFNCATEIKEKLKKYNPILDCRADYRPGFKFHEWELKGIPLRIEIGPRDVEENKVVLVRRDNGQKSFVHIKEVDKKVKEILYEIQEDLYAKAKEFLYSNIEEVNKFENFSKTIGHGKIVFTNWCGCPKCEEYIKGETGAKSLNIPLDQPDIKGKCIACEKDAKYKAYFGKSY